MFVQGGLVKYQASQIHNNAMFGSDGGAPVLTNDVSLQVFMEYLNACKLKLLVQTGAPPSSPNMLGIIVGLWRVDFAQQKSGLWAYFFGRNGVGIVRNETCVTMQHFLLFMFNVKPRTYVVERNRLYTSK